MMKTYLVGGSVRDEILGLPVTDHDYVVVGSRRTRWYGLAIAR